MGQTDEYEQMNEILEQLNDVTAMIAEAREAVGAGEIVDLSEIQARVQNVCLRIKDFPPNDSTSVEAKINAMVEDLNSLARELKTQQLNLGSDVIRSAVRDAYKMPKDKG